MTLVKFNSHRPVYRGYTDMLDRLFTADQLLKPGISYKVPAANTFETEKNFSIELAVPGYKKEDFKIQLEKHVLSISADINNAQESAIEAEKYNRREFQTISFNRRFTLPESADLNSIEAGYQDGVLEVKIGKKEEVRTSSREISVT